MVGKEGCGAPPIRGELRCDVLSPVRHGTSAGTVYSGYRGICA